MFIFRSCLSLFPLQTGQGFVTSTLSGPDRPRGLCEIPLLRRGEPTCPAAVNAHRPPFPTKRVTHSLKKESGKPTARGRALRGLEAAWAARPALEGRRGVQGSDRRGANREDAFPLRVLNPLSFRRPPCRAHPGVSTHS